MRILQRIYSIKHTQQDCECIMPILDTIHKNYHIFKQFLANALPRHKSIALVAEFIQRIRNK